MGIRAVAKMALHAAGFRLERITKDDDEGIAECESRTAEQERRIKEYEHRITEHERRISEHERRITEEERKNLNFINFLCSANGGSELARRFVGDAVQYLSYSKSQLLQDIFVLAALRERRGGFFVEFGASDGISLSNTYMLEKEFGWSGILSEPNRTFTPKLAANRPLCAVDSRCVWSATGETVSFTETTEHPGLSTVTQFAECDFHDRSQAVCYPVETVSLGDLLVQHNAPQEIDYLSIDTEGSELTILRAFDFSRSRFNVITVEHNFAESARDGIHALLTSHRYTRVLTEFSSIDDWYIIDDLIWRPRSPRTTTVFG
jgi:FkbM family methyltransferase